MNHTSTHPVSQSVTKASSMTSQSVISHHIMTPSPLNITHHYDTVTPKHHPPLWHRHLQTSPTPAVSSPLLLPLKLPRRPCLSPGPQQQFPEYSLHICPGLPPVPLQPAARMVFLSAGYCLSCKRKETLRKCMCVCHLCKKKYRRGKPKTSVINTIRSWVGKLS